MKARTQAQKIRAKRGRPLKQGVTRRETDGRISESKKSMETLALEAATWKRRQINPSLTIDEARKPEHGSVIALWLADWQRTAKRNPDGHHPNVFTQLHYDTALRFHELHARYMGSIAARTPRSASDFGGPGGVDGRDPFAVDIARAHRSAEAAYKDARRVILESGPLGMMAVETIILENKPSEELRGDLRQALNRLSVLWRLASAA